MIRFVHYEPSGLLKTSHWGFVFETHPRRFALDIYAGKHTFVFWIGRRYL